LEVLEAIEREKLVQQWDGCDHCVSFDLIKQTGVVQHNMCNCR
jgi:hypothetical protein